MSEDPMGFAAGDYNLSRYVFASPTNFTDPSGLETGLLEKVAEGAGAAARKTAPIASGTLKFGGKLLGPLGKIYDYLIDTEPMTDDKTIARIRKKNGNPQPTSSASPSPTSSPTPSPSSSPAPNTQPQNNPSCQQQQQKNPCSGQTLGGTYNQVSYSNRRTGSTPHHMPGWAAIEASGIALGQNKKYYYTKTPTACMSSVDHESTESFKYMALSIAYVKRVSEIIKTQSFYDAQLEDVKEIKHKFPGIYDKGILEMQNYTRNLMATEPSLFK